MAFMFEKLEVYQKAVDFADRIAALTEGFPRGYWFLADQLNRAALSIAANIAEGNGRFTKADRKHFFSIARGSTQECVPLAEVARRRVLPRQPRRLLRRVLVPDAADRAVPQAARAPGLDRVLEEPETAAGKAAVTCLHGPPTVQGPRVGR